MAYLSEDGTEDLTFILFQSCTSVTISKFIPGLLQKKENVAVKIGLHRNVLQTTGQSVNIPLDGLPWEGRGPYQLWGVWLLAITSWMSGDVPLQRKSSVVCVPVQMPAEGSIESYSHWKALSPLFGYQLLQQSGISNFSLSLCYSNRSPGNLKNPSLSLRDVRFPSVACWGWQRTGRGHGNDDWVELQNLSFRSDLKCFNHSQIILFFKNWGISCGVEVPIFKLKSYKPKVEQ